MASPSEVKAYLREHRRLSLSELTVHFCVSDDTMRALLEPWIAKRKIRRIDGGSCGASCKSCCCGAMDASVYEWCDAT